MIGLLFKILVKDSMFANEALIAELAKGESLKKIMSYKADPSKVASFKQQWANADSNTKIKRIAVILGLTALYLKQLFRGLIMIEFSSIIGESQKNIQLVKQKINEITASFEELEAIDLLFVQSDVYPETHIEKQRALYNARVAISSIKTSLKEIWSNQKIGTNDADVVLVKSRLVGVFRAVTMVVNDVRQYVVSYNEISKKNLIFDYEWGNFFKRSY